MEKYILNDTGQKVSTKKKNPLLQPTNVTEENKQHSQTTNSANNIVPIDKIKVNQNNFYELKEKAKKISILHFLTESKTKHRYVCPFCGSGTGSKRTGSIIANSDNTFHCNACSKHGDVIALYMQVKGVDFKTAIEELANDKISYTKTQPIHKPKESKPEPDFTQIINQASSKFKGSPAEQYINNRGISTKVAERFKLGYSESIYFNGIKNNALIVPVSKTFYFGRNLNPNSPDRFHNVSGGINTLFNKQALQQHETPVFVNESVIDALSIIEIESHAVALNGVDLKLLTQNLKSLNEYPTLILCLDNDKTGTNKTNELRTELQKIGIKFIDGRFILNDCKDANEALIKDRNAFIQAVKIAKQIALDLPEIEEKKHQPPAERPSYIVDTKNGEKVHTSKLANFILKNSRLLSVQDKSSTSRHFLYNNNYYKHVTNKELRHFIRCIIAEYNEDLCSNYVHETVLKNIDDGIKPTSESKLNGKEHEHLINFQNGILNLNTMQLEPHNEDILITRQVPCNWADNEHETPYFDKYLNDLTDGDQNTKYFLLQFMGCIFSNVDGSRFKKSLFLVGKGDSGKSQAKLLTEMILDGDNEIKGENYTAIDLEQLATRFGAATLYNKRLAGSSDMSSSFVNHLSVFKQITGGDSIQVENKGKDSFSMRYNGFLWFCCNEMPNFGGDKGKWVYDRMIIIKCDNVIPELKRDPNLIDKMYAEREGIVRKCVLAARNAIKTKKFDIPETAIQEKEQFRIETNNTVRFCVECLQPLEDKETGNIRKPELYAVYREWCSKQGYKNVVGSITFYKELCEYFNLSSSELFFHIKRGDFLDKYTLTWEIFSSYQALLKDSVIPIRDKDL